MDKLNQVKKLINDFDKDFDDPYECLQKIAKALGIEKTINETAEEK